MNIVYTDALRKYFEKKGRSDVLLHTISPAGCCGGAPELIIDLLKPEQVEDAAQNNIRVFEGELGKVLMERWLVPEDPDATVTLGLERFLGMGDITATGLRKLA